MSEPKEIKIEAVPPLNIDEINAWWDFISNGMIRTRVMTREEMVQKYPPTPN
jgi:hypothetical protein